MKTATMIKLVIAGLGGVLVWCLWPVYGFFAHNGDLPLPPTGWVDMAEDAPVSQTLTSPDYETAGNKALEALARHREKIGAPGMSAAVAIDGKLVWTGVSGWADLQKRTPVTPDTQFRIGSTSKALTATALARLVDGGVLALDTPLRDIFDDLPNPAWAEITPRQLASHMAGLPHYKENTELSGLYHSMALRNNFRDTRDAVTLFDGSDLLYEPGTDFFYSSLGTVLLGAAMSEAAGKSYRQIIREEVLDPAGATATIVAPKRPPKGSALATFYLQQDERYRPWRPVDLSHRLPGGGFASTPSDLVKIGSLQLNDTFIHPATRSAFWTPQRLKDGVPNEQDYAIGWRWKEFEVDSIGPVRNANHGGVSRGSQSWLMVLPDYNMVIAININKRTDPFWVFGSFYTDLLRAFVPAIPE